MSASAIQQFDIFAQLVASGNITASARTLGIAAADIVLAMNALEDRLGFQIFTMSGSSVDLTESGHKLVSALGEMALDTQEKWINGLASTPAKEFETTGSSKSESQHMDIPPPKAESPSQEKKAERPEQPFPSSPPRQSVTASSPDIPSMRAREAIRTIVLASHPGIFSHFQEALLAFEEASPDIGITMRLEGVGPNEVADLFARKLADIAYFYTLEESTGFPSRYAWSERISLFVGEGHPLAKKDSALAEDLAATPYVALTPGNHARTLAEEALARTGLKVGPALTETDNLYEIMKQVRSRPCYFAAFGPMARDFGKMPGIVRLAWAQGLPQVQVRQAVRDDLADDPAILALAEFLFR